MTLKVDFLKLVSDNKSKRQAAQAVLCINCSSLCYFLHKIATVLCDNNCALISVIVCSSGNTC